MSPRPWLTFTLAAGAFLLSGAALALSLTQRGSASPAVVQAERFELVDGHGQVRAVLGLEGAAAILGLRDGAGTTRVKLESRQQGWRPEDDRAAVELNDADGSPRIGLQAGTSSLGDDASVVLWSPSGDLRMNLIASEGTSWLGLYDSCREPECATERIVLRVWDGAGVSRSSIEVSDPEHRLRSRLGAYGDGTARLEMLDPERQIRAALGTAADGTPDLFLFRNQWIPLP